MSRFKARFESFAKTIAPKFFLKMKVQNYITEGGLNRNVWGEKMFKEEIDKAIKRILPKALSDTTLHKQYTEYMVAVYLELGITPSEFLEFRFKPFTPIKEMSGYLSQKNKDLLLMSKLHWKEAWDETNDKPYFYSKHKKFYKREICSITEPSDKEVFISFCSKHKEFIFKPNFGLSGIGIRIIRATEIKEKGLTNLFDELLEQSNDKGFVLEELIHQSEWMKQWNESSVNTVRISTIKTKDGIFSLMPVFFFGRNGVEVSNGHFGGFSVAIDQKSGRLISRALSIIDGLELESCPSNNMPIKGMSLPDWEEVVSMSKEIHEGLSSIHHFIGFDFAHTDNGWVLIEVNWDGGLGISQSVFSKGCRKEYEELMSKTF